MDWEDVDCNFLGVTLHFVDICEIESMTWVTSLTERRIAEYKQEVFSEVMEKWGMSWEKVSAVVTEGASDITKTADTMLGKREHLHCFAHQINLVIERAIGSDESLIN